ncbi:MAG: hypothetical protein KC897_02300 [Candidatus Omnitrophica bacterium]|nr:hypothetical protein [Candidatus Omnitrophota bacterium]MCB9721065.1 hypothetical protein [Candidatus Omnitrophota bacterium]
MTLRPYISRIMRRWRGLTSLVTAVCLIVSTGPVYGLTDGVMADLPAPGTMLDISPVYHAPVIQGITLDPDNPLQFDFLVNQGEERLSDEELSAEARRLIKFFLTALTVPEDRLWVNLSPYEADRIIPAEFGQTDMGRELLAQDYLLKQLSASMLYPEKELGRTFWERVQAKAFARFGTTEIPMNTFNKVWIVPDKAVIHRDGTTVMVLESRMRVMLEEDYVALSRHALGKDFVPERSDIVSGISADVVREVLIPEIEREVNEGRNFARLRQIYQSLILAVWYKQHLRDSLLGQLYVDRGKTGGIAQPDVQANEYIYRKYVEAFERGVYNYIREDIDPLTDQRIPRKYFSGGVDYAQMAAAISEQDDAGAGIPVSALRRVRARLDGLGDGAEALRQLAKGESDGDQAILVERILPESDVSYLRELWRRLVEQSDTVDAETGSDIEYVLNGRAEEGTQWFAVVGNWMRMLDRAEEILDTFAPNRPIDLDSPSNMFQLSLEKMLYGFARVFSDDHKGIMIVRVRQYAQDKYRFDTFLLDRSGDFFVNGETGSNVPIDHVLATQFTSRQSPDFDEALASAVWATDRFSVLSVRPNGADISDARYWESLHYRKPAVELGERRFRRPPVKQGTAIVMTTFIRRDEYGHLKRDDNVTDSAALAEEEQPFSQGILQIAGWLGNAVRRKRADEPLVLVLHGRHGAGKTVTKDLIVGALEEFGYRLDPLRRKNGSKTIHRYNAWRAEDHLEEAWANNFDGHTGIIIVETVEKPVPEEWRKKDNLLFVHLRAAEDRRRARIEAKGVEWAGQLEIKARHESWTSLGTFAHRVLIENSGTDINKVFNGTMKFQTVFERTQRDNAVMVTAAPSAKQVVSDADAVGGIDLNPANLELETRGDADELHFSVNPSLLRDMSVDGFVPVILNISPVNSLPLLLGSDPGSATSPDPDAVSAEPPAISAKISRR